MSHNGDVIMQHIVETRRQFPDGCGLQPPHQLLHISSAELFDELVERLELQADPGTGFAMSPATDRLRLYVFAPSRAPRAKRRR